MKTNLIKVALVLGSLISLMSVAQIAQPQASDEPIVVVALAKLKPGHQEDFKKAANILVEATRKEQGVLSYHFNQSIDDPTEFAFVERYRTLEAFNAHMNSLDLKVFFDSVSPFFETGYPQIRKFQEVEE